jgi:site-specific DNA-methyltransferase (adenine-specific)
MQIKQREIFSLGDNKIACGRAQDQELVKKLCGKEKIRLILADPPYGVGLVENKDWLGLRGVQSEHFKKFQKMQGDHLQTEKEYTEFTKEWLEAAKSYLAEKNAFYIFNSDLMVCSLRKGIEQAGGRYSQMIIWIKNQAVLGRKDFNPMHELIIYGWFNSHKFERSKSKSVIFFPKPQKSTIHPTMKPPGLLRKLILNSTGINEVVYDPFLGSGSTLIACEQIKRKCFGIEICEHYVESAIRRWEKLTGLKAQKIYGP